MPLLWFEWAALVLLILFLIWRCHQYGKRHPREEKKFPPGHGFDTSPLQARVKAVRADHLDTATARTKRTPSHDLFVLAVRRSLATLSYFHSSHRTDPEDSLESRDKPG